jgi:central kinetochore subunit Mal2/MCM21
MAPVANPTDPLKMDSIDSLDDQIANMKSQIKSLEHTNTLLKSSLLASTKVQSRLTEVEDTSLNLTTKKHSTSNVHRLAFGVTTFPFNDPAPEIKDKGLNPLLGVRFDVCNWKGRFERPRYVFLIREGDGQEAGERLKVYRHTIPAFIPLDRYEERYLVRETVDEGYGGSDDSGDSAESAGRRQDLRGLVARVRSDLVSWRARKDAAAWLREELELPNQSTASTSNDDGEEKADGDVEMTTADAEEDGNGDEDEDPLGKYGVSDMNLTTIDARNLEIFWADNSVATLRISDDGSIEKAVVIDSSQQRDNSVERTLMGDNGKSVMVIDLLSRLQIVHQKKAS